MADVDFSQVVLSHLYCQLVNMLNCFCWF